MSDQAEPFEHVDLVTLRDPDPWGVMPSSEPLLVARPRGSRHGRSKLTEAQVSEARLLYFQGWSCRRLGRRYGVHKATIDYAVTGRTWRHLPFPVTVSVRAKSKPRRRRWPKPGASRGRRPWALSAQETLEAQTLYVIEGLSLRSLAERFEVSPGTIRRAIRGPSKRTLAEAVAAIAASHATADRPLSPGN